MNCFKNAKRAVIKVGTSTLTYPSGHIHIRRMESLVKVLSDLKNSGMEIVLVSSGAIGVGVGKLGLRSRPTDIPSTQAAAAVGQCELMHIYDKLFLEYNHIVSQVLLTRDVVETPVLKANAMNTFKRLLELGSLPIVNENDTVATEEIEARFGENDALSAIVAVLIGADALVLMSDIDGLYTDDPRENPNATLIQTVTRLDDGILSMAHGSGSENGTGGMITKLRAAEICCPQGVDMAIINGSNPYLLYDLFDGKQVGTHFVAGKGQA